MKKSMNEEVVIIFLLFLFLINLQKLQPSFRMFSYVFICILLVYIGNIEFVQYKRISYFLTYQGKIFIQILTNMQYIYKLLLFVT